VIQVVVIMQIFRSPTQAIDTLSNEVLDGVIDQIQVSMIGDAAGKSGNDSRPSFI
jgi:hypothetical protein